MYFIKISEEGKPYEATDQVVYDQVEESKSDSGDSNESSLITEEDTSGNPLPPEIIEIRRKNKRMQRNLTNGLMNYKSTSRSLLDSEASQDNQEEKKIDDKGYRNEKKEKTGQKSSVKGVLEQIIKLNGQLDAAKKKVNENKSLICVKDQEFIELSRNLDNVEGTLKSIAESRKMDTGCNCCFI